MLNLHRVFTEASTETDFLTQLTVSRAREQELRNARNSIRETLQEGFQTWDRVVERQAVMESAAVRKGLAEQKLRPKFRMQGSACPAYRTLNDPAHEEQQIDYDDGVYLPVSFLAETGNPVIAAAGYYLLVEAIVTPLCQKMGWTLDRTTKKCVRIVIDEKAHVDLPLYAIPDEEFILLAEDIALASAFDRSMLIDTAVLDDALYERLNEDELRLALREGKWIKSDPRLLEDWFKQAVEEHGLQVRRVSRYLKGWRDFIWPNECRLSSIILMKCVVDAFDEARGSAVDSRDDLAMLEVASRLEGYFGGDIRNPRLDLSLNEHWSPQDRAFFRQKARELYRCMHEAVRGTSSPEDALTILAEVFGPRIPQEIALVSATAEATVRSYQPTKIPARNVPRTTSG